MGRRRRPGWLQAKRDVCAGESASSVEPVPHSAAIRGRTSLLAQRWTPPCCPPVARSMAVISGCGCGCPSALRQVQVHTAGEREVPARGQQDMPAGSNAALPRRLGCHRDGAARYPSPTSEQRSGGWQGRDVLNELTISLKTRSRASRLSQAWLRTNAGPHATLASRSQSRYRVRVEDLWTCREPCGGRTTSWHPWTGCPRHLGQAGRLVIYSRAKEGCTSGISRVLRSY